MEERIALAKKLRQENVQSAQTVIDKLRRDSRQETRVDMEKFKNAEEVEVDQNQYTFSPSTIDQLSKNTAADKPRGKTPYVKTDIIDRGYLFFSVKDRNLFHRVDTIGNIFMSGAATSENIMDGVHKMK